ncbi:MAG: hypothetical protein KKE17_02990 [Proteobacteria bacterium]|nr:hypothetical protein [Pseudomonadota bacterium]MBU1708948.1 hypothetical protein [Pseudomonadota bacterium]
MDDGPRAIATVKVKEKPDTRFGNSGSAKDGVEAVSKTNLLLIGGAAAIVGFWAIACLASAINDQGISQIVKSWLSSLAG